AHVDRVLQGRDHLAVDTRAGRDVLVGRGGSADGLGLHQRAVARAGQRRQHHRAGGHVLVRRVRGADGFGLHVGAAQGRHRGLHALVGFRMGAGSGDERQGQGGDETLAGHGDVLQWKKGRSEDQSPALRSAARRWARLPFVYCSGIWLFTNALASKFDVGLCAAATASARTVARSFWPTTGALSAPPAASPYTSPWRAAATACCCTSARLYVESMLSTPWYSSACAAPTAASSDTAAAAMIFEVFISYSLLAWLAFEQERCRHLPASL